jgi:hypothetical protein
MVSQDVYTAMGDYAGSTMVPADNQPVRDPVGKAVASIVYGGAKAIALGLAELPFEVADVVTAGYNVVTGSNLPVNNSMLGQMAERGAGTGDLLVEVAKNTASVIPFIGVGRASFNGTQALMAGDLEGVGAGLVGVGGSFAVGSAMGYGKVGIEFESLQSSGPGGSQMGAIARPYLVDLADPAFVGPPRPYSNSVRVLDVETYGNAAARSIGDGLTPDHIPSFAAVRASMEQQFGRPLEPFEVTQLRNNTNALVVDTALHQELSVTYGGRNTPAQIANDSINLRAAAERDLSAYTQRLLDSGYSPQAVQNAAQALHDANVKAGLYK